MKIIKLLIVELGSGAPTNSWKTDVAQALEEPTSDEGEWEDEDVIDLNSYATKQSNISTILFFLTSI